MPMKCWQPQIFYICKPYLFFHTMICLVIHVWQPYLLFHSMTTYGFLVWQTYFLFLINTNNV